MSAELGVNAMCDLLLEYFSKPLPQREKRGFDSCSSFLQEKGLGLGLRESCTRRELVFDGF